MPLKGYQKPKKTRATPADDRKLPRSEWLREMGRLSKRFEGLKPIRPRGEDGKRPPRGGDPAADGPDPERKPAAKKADVPPEPVHGWDKPLRRPKGE